MTEREEILKEFVDECTEGLNKLDQDLVALESNPKNKEIMVRTFRTIHSIKGAAGCLTFKHLESVTHVGESLLCLLRDEKMDWSQDITSALLEMLDTMRRILVQIQLTQSEGEQDCSAIVARLTQLVAGANKSAPPPDSLSASVSSPVPVAPLVTEPVPASKQAPTVPVPHPLAESSIRVTVELLDKIMNLVGELVLVRNQINQIATQKESLAVLASSQRLNLITMGLQEGIMKTRMQPIENIWSKFPRIVRDVATSCSKKVRLEMKGSETELDKSIIEAIRDPLTHMIRNCIDHGIERPEVRKAAGKPEEGKLLLRAYHEGGLVNIEIADDGAGINLTKIKEKALERSLISQQQADQMSDREAINLIFLPGFSTAEKVTHVSGRGVGMDVVKSNIEGIGGIVDISTQLNHGSVFKIKIPLTLAIIPALMVRGGFNRYAIPLSSVLELVRIEEGRQGIEMIQGTPVFRLREKLLPILYLNQELGLKGKSMETPGTSSPINIAVLQAGDRSFGLVVDKIHDTQEIVVKPLGKQLKSIQVYSGATILGDGKIALIIDVLNLAKRASILLESQENLEKTKTRQSGETSVERQNVILTHGADGRRLAISLPMVSRLEKFNTNKVEEVGDVRVIQYRGHILPLIYLSEVLPEKKKTVKDTFLEKEVKEKIDVVVYSDQKTTVGLVVDRILDIVDYPVNELRPIRREGVLGCVVIQNRVTEVLDVQGIIASNLTTYFSENPPEMKT